MKKASLIIIRTTTEDHETYNLNSEGEMQPHLSTKGSPSSAYIVKGYVTKLFFFGRLVKSTVSPDGQKNIEAPLIKVPVRNCNVYADTLTLEFPETYDYDSVRFITILDNADPDFQNEIIENLNFIYN